MKGLESLRSLTATACVDGNWDYSPYMMGMANGMLLAVHIMEGKRGEPNYLSSPDEWLCDTEDASVKGVPLTAADNFAIGDFHQ